MATNNHRADLAKTTVELPELLHRKLRIKAAVERRTINEIVVDCLEDCFKDFRIDPDTLEVETTPRYHPEGTRRSTV